MKALHNSTLIQFAFLVVAAVLVGAYFLTRTVGLSDHHQRMESLLHQQRLEARLDRGALQVSSFLLAQYDELVDLTHAMRRTMDELRSNFATVLSRDPNQESILSGHLELLERKLDLLERLKSQAAFVRNGLYYLPLAVSDISKTDADMGARLSGLLNQLMLFGQLPGKPEHDAILNELNQLQSQLADSPSPEALGLVLHHLHQNLRSIERLDQIRGAYAGLPTYASFDKLYASYQQYQEARDSRSGGFSVFLVLAIVFLFTGLGVAITKLTRAREHSDRARMQLHDAVESLSEAFALFDADGRLLLHNSRFEAYYPWLEGKLVAHATSTADVIRYGESAGGFADMGSQIAQPMPAADTEGRVERSYVERLSNGSWYLASDSGTSTGGLACVRTDITQSKQQEYQLQKLGRALEQSPATVVITNVKGDIEYVNPKFVETTGYAAEDALGKNPRILKSGDKTIGDYEQLWKTITAGREWRGQFHNRRKDGSIYWESATISPMRDDQGEITHFIAVKEDITARKRAEEQLRLNATVFDSINEGIMVTDADNRITTVNPAFSAITGYEPEDVIGQTPSILQSGRHDREFYGEMWGTLEQRDAWNGEIWNRRKDGSIFPEWLSIAVQRDLNGKVTERVAVFSDITRRKHDEEQIRYQANYDALTGLPNRHLLFDRLQLAVSVAHRRDRIVALLFIDLDGFKAINDTMGHLVGDELLNKVGQRLTHCLRESDSVGRFGGDEFAVILQDVAEISQAGEVAGNIIASLDTGFNLRGRDIYIGASVGICMYPDDAMDATTMLRNADMAMYKAKEDGRNRYHFYTDDMHARMHARMELERDLRRAIERDELDLVYQPIVRLSDEGLHEVEALLRWTHPEYGQVSPAEFIPLAEQTALIGPIGKWVLQRACRQLAEWRANGAHELKVGINVSSRQWSLGLTPENVQEVLKTCGLPAGAIVVEITENSIIDNSDQALEWLRAVKSQGVSLAIDDFGTGYSSLSYLKRFPMDTLKIDRSFIKDLPGDSGDLSLVKAILAMGKSLNLQVVAEGVETREQADLLRDLGCDFGQGFLFSRPVAAERINEMACVAVPALVKAELG